MTVAAIGVRQATVDDADAMTRVLNEIIDEGGRTAIEGPVTAADLADWYLDGPTALGCVVAVRGDGPVVGFQALERHHGGLADDEADIGTFIDTAARGGGVGRALALATFGSATSVGLRTLRAVIRADNAAAIAYYRALGFAARGDGTVVAGRIVLYRSMR